MLLCIRAPLLSESRTHQWATLLQWLTCLSFRVNPTYTILLPKILACTSDLRLKIVPKKSLFTFLWVTFVKSNSAQLSCSGNNLSMYSWPVFKDSGVKNVPEAQRHRQAGEVTKQPSVSHRKCNKNIKYRHPFTYQAFIICFCPSTRRFIWTASCWQITGLPSENRRRQSSVREPSVNRDSSSWAVPLWQSLSVTVQSTSENIVVPRNSCRVSAPRFHAALWGKIITLREDVCNVYR